MSNSPIRGGASAAHTLSLILLAAGTSSRMKTDGALPHKLLLPVAGEPMIVRTLSIYAKLSFTETIVVCGAEIQTITSFVQQFPAKIVPNEHYIEGISSSLRCGIEAAALQSEGYLVALADMPWIQPGTIQRMIQRFSEARERHSAPIIAPMYDGKRGNPVLFDRFYRSELLALEGDIGAQSLIRRHAASFTPVHVEDQGVLQDIDTPEEYYALPS